MKELLNFIILLGAMTAFIISIPLSVVLMAFELAKIGKEKMFQNIAENTERINSITPKT